MDTRALSSDPTSEGPFRDVLRDIRQRALEAQQQDLEHRAATSLVRADRTLSRIQDRARTVVLIRGLLEETAVVLPGAEVATGYYGGDERLTLRTVRETQDDAGRAVRILSEVSFQVLSATDELQVVFRQTMGGRNADPERWTFPADDEGWRQLEERATRRLARFVGDSLAPAGGVR